jgi:threonine/homoserine/homoserine lactone efflux protein
LSGLGAASADAVYGSLAAFGLAAVFQRYTWIQNWTQIIGGAFIIYLGTRFVLTRAVESTDGKGLVSGGVGRVYLTTFLLTMSNPVTIFAFLGMFAGAGVSTMGSAIWMVSGIFSGSMLWWIVLAFLTHWLGQKLNAQVLLWVNRIAGAALIGFGLWAVISAAFKLL